MRTRVGFRLGDVEAIVPRRATPKIGVLNLDPGIPSPIGVAVWLWLALVGSVPSGDSL